MPINTAVATDNWSHYRRLRDGGHREFVEKDRRCRDFAAGRHWNSKDLQALKEQGRPALTINKILSTLGTVSGEQIKNRVEVVFRPTAGAQDAVAEALSKVWMQIAQNNQLSWKRSDVFWDGIVAGRGFYDARIDFSDSMMGEVRVSQLNPKNVLIDPEAESYDPDEWNEVILTKWMTWEDIAALYNRKDAELLKNMRGEGLEGYGVDTWEEKDCFASGQLGHMPYYPAYTETDDPLLRNIRVVERQYRKFTKQLHFVDVQNGDTRPIPENWDENRISALLQKYGGQMGVTEQPTKRIRWTVSAGPVVLHDEWSPFEHFTVVPYFPYFFHGETIGIVEGLIDPSELLNKTLSQELHVINTSANSGWVVEEGSITNMSMQELEARGATTGLVMEYKKGAQPPQKIQPNQVPTGLDRVSYKAEEFIKTISNISDSMQGFDREDVAAKAIMAKQQAGSVNLVKMFDNLERTDWLLARNVLSLVQNYYTEPRLLNITHDDFRQEQEQVAINQPDPTTGEITNDLTMGEYDIVISSSPYRASMEDSQFEQAVALRQLGVQIDDSVLIENSRLLRRAEIVKQINDARNSPEAQEQQQLQQRAQLADIAVKESKAQKTQVDAQMNMVKAQRLASGADDAAALQNNQSKAQLEADKAQIELARLQAELELKQQELEMKRQEGQQKLALQQAKDEQDSQRRNFELRARQEAEDAQREEEAAAERLALLNQSFNNDEDENT